MCVYSVSLLKGKLVNFWFARCSSKKKILRTRLCLYSACGCYAKINYSGIPKEQIDIQWSPSVTDTIGNQNFVRNSEVSLTQGLPVGVACVIGLLSTTWLRLQSFPLLYAGRECYPEASTTSNSANLMSSC